MLLCFVLRFFQTFYVPTTDNYSNNNKTTTTTMIMIMIIIMIIIILIIIIIIIIIIMIITPFCNQVYIRWVSLLTFHFFSWKLQHGMLGFHKVHIYLYIGKLCNSCMQSWYLWTDLYWWWVWSGMQSWYLWTDLYWWWVWSGM